MTIDLTHVLVRASENAERWTATLVLSTLGSVREAIQGSEVDWEEGDEQWARLLVEQDVVALVSARVPLVLAADLAVSSASFPDFVVWCRTGDMSAMNYRVEKTVLEEIFERELTDNVDYEHLSIHDLWWATV